MSGFDLEFYKRRREELGMTLEALAQRSGVPRRTVDNIFRGLTPNPRVDTLEKIDRALLIDSDAEMEKMLSGDEYILVRCYRSLPKSDKVILLSAMRSIFPRLENDIDLDRVRHLIEGGADDNENSTGES